MKTQLPLILALTACATTAPLARHLVDPIGSPHQAYPSASHICALGVVSGPSGSLQAAEAKARQGVASQVNSTIAAEVSRTTSQQINQRDGRTAASSQTTAESRMVQQSSYDNAELIRTVDSASTAVEHRALACLDRKEAAQVVLDGIAAPLVRHAEAAKTALSAAEAGDVAGFSAAFSEAKQAEEPLRGELYIARVLLGGLSPRHLQFHKESKALVQHASQLRSTLNLVVAPEKRNAADGAKMVRQSLARLGFSAESAPAPTCAGKSGAFSIAVDLDLGCPAAGDSNSLGLYVCMPTFSIRVTDCDRDAQVLMADVQGKSIRGSSNSLEPALRQTVARLNSDRLDAPLAKALAAALPTP